MSNIISAELRTARKPYVCAQAEAGMCIRNGLEITKGEDHVRVYGSAEVGDPPYAIRLHRECFYENPRAWEGQKRLCWNCRNLQPCTTMISSSDLPGVCSAQCKYCHATMGECRTR